MKLHGLSLCVLLVSIAVACAQTGAPPADDSSETIEKKIKILSDQINELRKKQDPPLVRVQKEAEQKRLKEAEQRKQEEVETSKQYAKVEIRGKLTTSSSISWKIGGFAPQMMTDQLTWTLKFCDFSDDRAFAEKNVGKAVVITGTIAIKPPSPPIKIGPNGMPTTMPFGMGPPPLEFEVHVQSLKLAEN